MKKILFYYLFSVAIFFTNKANCPDRSTIQGFLQYVMQPLDKNQIGNGYLEESGFPAISMATYNGTLSINNRFELYSSKNTGRLSVLNTPKNIHKTARIFYNKRIEKRYRKAQKLLTICLQSNITNTAFYKQKTAKIIQLNTHAFNRWLAHYLSLFALFKI
ncbi:MAG: hypothetical protein H7334_09775 [Ferruginibacter sp.]|nr:hypothetical protein [Ferruginibacter sp.]